jgi:DNA-binding phage protein
MKKVLTRENVVQLLRQQVTKAGGQSSWSRKTGIHRSLVNRVLQGRQRPTTSLLKVLQLETVYVQTKKASTRGQSQGPFRLNSTDMG